MKQRIITSVIGLVILAVVVLGFETLLLNVVVSLISLLALMELLKESAQSQVERSGKGRPGLAGGVPLPGNEKIGGGQLAQLPAQFGGQAVEHPGRPALTPAGQTLKGVQKPLSLLHHILHGLKIRLRVLPQTGEGGLW